MTDFEKVTDFKNMYRAFRKARCGKGHKKSSARFDLAALNGIHTLISQLKDKTYRVSDYNEFKVYEPKERVIQTTSFKDKVIQHSLCDNVIMPRLQRVFIQDNCARSSIPYLGYPQATLKLLKEAGYRIFCNGKMIR